MLRCFTNRQFKKRLRSSLLHVEVVVTTAVHHSFQNSSMRAVRELSSRFPDSCAVRAPSSSRPLLCLVLRSHCEARLFLRLGRLLVWLLHDEHGAGRLPQDGFGHAAHDES